ncbi:MAG: transaldolase family protein [Halioglobus sp.]|nr:transaldolase family protein [Halioglobus sp.]
MICTAVSGSGIGTLARLIAEDGLAGITSNPGNIRKRISKARDYDEDIAALARAGASPQAIYDALTIDHVRRAGGSVPPAVRNGPGGADGLREAWESHRIWHTTATKYRGRGAPVVESDSIVSML